MFQPMQGARRMVASEYRKHFISEWPTEEIARERDAVLTAKAAGLSVAQIAKETGIERRYVRNILFEEEELQERLKRNGEARTFSEDKIKKE